MTAHHFDRATVERAAAAEHQKSVSASEKSGSHGAQARLNAAVVNHFVLALTDEINRGTPMPDILDGIAAVVVNMLRTMEPANRSGPKACDWPVPELLDRILRFLEQSNHTHEGTVVAPMRGGHA